MTMKKSFKLSRVAYSISIAIPLSFFSLQLMASDDNYNNIIFPEIEAPSNCDEVAILGKCKKYDDTDPLDTLYSSAGDSTRFYKIENSFGFYVDKKQASNGNVIIINSPGSLGGVIRGISTNWLGGVSFNDNRIFINLNGQELKWNHTGNGPKTGDGGWISAAAATAGKQLSNNSVYIKNTIFSESGSIFGAYANSASSSYYAPFSQSTITGNTVILDNVTMKPNTSYEPGWGAIVAGAYLFSPTPTFDDSAKSESIDMSNNSVYIKKSNLALDSIAGAFVYTDADSGSFKSNNNLTFIDSSTVNTGDNVYNRLYSASAPNSQDNVLSIQNSTLNISTDKKSYSIRAVYSADKTAENNRLNISNTSINTLNENNVSAKNVDITGGYSYETSRNNKVILDNSVLGRKVTSINGGISNGYYEKSQIVADNNLVILNKTNMHNDLSVKGGYIHTVTPDKTQSVSASGNSIIVEGSHLAGSIYGGLLGTPDNPGIGKAENNSITIGAGQSGDFNALYGGYGAASDSTYRGNTLNLMSNVSTSSFGGFQHYNFYYSSNEQLSKPMLQINSGEATALVTSRGASENSTVTVLTKGINITDGTRFQLINNNSGFIDADTKDVLTEEDLKKIGQSSAPVFANFKSIATVEQYSHLKDYKLEISDGTLSAIISGNPENPENPENPSGEKKNDQTDIFSTASLASLSTAIASDDLLIDTVLTNSLNNKNGSFATVRYGDYKFNTKQKLRTEQTSALFGFAFDTNVIDYGFFIETGYNSYNSNTNSSYGKVYGNGHQSYGGTGLYFDYMTSARGIHATGYLKAGILYDDFGTNIALTNVDLSNSSTYWGAHAGIYWDAPVENDWNTRIYANYFYDGREKEQFKIHDSEITYSEIDSHRLQTGMFINYTGENHLQPYLGIGWEEMMNAGGESSIHDQKHHWSLDTDDMNGGSAVITAGFNYIIPNKNVEAGLNIKGYNGMRNGASAQIQVKWNF
ncbi:hypothetical protein LE024_24055 [Escherichia coli]|uniref:hypothetical protein n=1 Tax=Escherichia coli TaxID=562 RepID=UPI001D0B7528|nr:hypothetical protein [Escherichia coli]MCA7684540.1 hypothetical protein [Escherichia coli]MCB8789614.1 hypothetical protein [Escherichia coli]MCB8794060.1 hypothetical protein [Escherichia coli]